MIRKYKRQVKNEILNFSYKSAIREPDEADEISLQFYRNGYEDVTKMTKNCSTYYSFSVFFITATYTFFAISELAITVVL